MRLTVFKDWQYRDRVRGGVCVLAAGEYRVPEQVAAAVADLCVSQGMGQLADAEPAIAEAPEGYGAEPLSKRARRRRKGKGPAPENKLLHVPENKQALV